MQPSSSAQHGPGRQAATVPAPAAPGQATPLGESDLADLRLIEAVRGGQPGAWSSLLSQYQDRLFGVCVRMLGPGTRSRQTAADLCQDAMVKIIQGLPTFDGSAKFSTWAIRVTMNVCLSHLRGAKLRAHASLDEHAHGHAGTADGAGRLAFDRSGTRGSGLPGREPNAPSSVLRDEQRSLIAAALVRIDPDQRSILVLRDVRGLDYDQIAHVLGVAVGTVKSRLFRARAALRQAVEAMEPHERAPADPDES